MQLLHEIVAGIELQALSFSIRFRDYYFLFTMGKSELHKSFEELEHPVPQLQLLSPL
jgi:hypothetical protein